MNLRKTRLWLALTGWLPWACYFGLHDRKYVCTGRHIGDYPGAIVFMHAPHVHWSRPVVYLCRETVCKRCGRAW